MNKVQVFLLCCLAAPACKDAAATSDGGSLAGDGAADGVPATIDGQKDVQPVTDTSPATTVRFTFENQTGKTIYILNQGFWALLRGGVALRPEDACGICNCGNAACAVCAQVAPQPIAIPAGAAHTWTWAGFDFKLGATAQDGGMCEQPEPAAPGTLTARVTYSLSKVDATVGSGSTLGPALTKDQSFEHPQVESVLVIAR